jgi:hypothetical protein
MTFAQIKKRNKSTQNKNNQPFFRSLFSPGLARIEARPLRYTAPIYRDVLANTGFSTRLSFLVRRQFTRGRKSAVSMRSR